jgi:MFS family permease
MARLETHAFDKTEPSSALAPLRVPVFRSVWFASLLSNFGSIIQSVGAAWLMTSIARSADTVALVQTSVTLPFMLLSLLAGAMADSFDRRRMMLTAQLAMFLVSLALAICAWLEVITPWLLLCFTFAIACGTAFNAPAWQASVGDMVPRTHLPSAVALNSMGYNIARSAGPALGGFIVAAAGPAAAFALNALSYTALIYVLMRWRPPVRQMLPPEPLAIAMAAGIRYVSMSPAIRTVLTRGFVFGVGASVVMALLPLVAKHLVGGGALTYGVLLGAFGVGAVCGGFGNAKVRAALSTEGIVRWGSIAFAIACLVIAFSTQAWLTIIALLVSGAAWVLVLSTFNVTVQMSAPRWVVARALSLYQMTTFGGMALGAWLWGAIAEGFDLAPAIVGAAVVALLSALLGRVLPLAEIGALNLDPARTWNEPQTAVPVEPRTGPVVVAIEYIIDPEDILEFLALMAERRRIRRRDGARNWTLLRDLSDPRLWIERYQTPTWLEYIRHNSRMTQEDAVIPERLRALHRGSGPPVVRRMIERQTGALPNGHTTPHDLAEPMTDPSRSA